MGAPRSFGTREYSRIPKGVPEIQFFLLFLFMSPSPISELLPRISFWSSSFKNRSEDRPILQKEKTFSTLSFINRRPLQLGTQEHQLDVDLNSSGQCSVCEIYIIFAESWILQLMH